ncbi:MAG: hypothetical protein WC304_01495 [Candidatus Gracilibacteria bacterium]|jgi:hypothetical protein
MNNLKLFQAIYSDTEMPTRSVYLEARDFTERLDAPQDARVGKPEGETLEARRKNLDKKKLEKRKGYKKELEYLAEETGEKSWEKVAEKIHKLDEWHKREVGVAVEIGKNEYLLVHTSQEDFQLIMEEHKDKSPEDLKKALDEMKIAYDKDHYTKDKIPTVKPISKMKKGDIAGKAVDSPEATANKTYNKDLEAIKAGLNKQPEVASPTEILSAENISYNHALVKLYGKGKVPAEISRVFNLSKEVDVARLKTDPKYVKETFGSVFRMGSTNEFQAKVREAQNGLDPNSADFQSFERVLAAFKVMDITYGNVSRGDSLEKRLTTMEDGVNKLPGLKGFNAQKLFADVEKGVGVNTDWQEFYNKNSKAENAEVNDANKGKLASILDGGEVQMLRVDRKTHGGKQFEAFIDRMPGAAFKNSLDVPQAVRGDSAYVYKYAEISGESVDKAIAKYRENHKEWEKACEGLNQEQIRQSFKVAQVEIPNCENPAIVVKPNFKEKLIPPPVAALEDMDCEEALSLVKAYKNVPGGLSLVFRPLDWFATDAEKNMLADPAILDMKGKVLRESEYLNTSKRLTPHAKKRLNDGMADILGRGESADSLSSFDKMMGKKVRSADDIRAEFLAQKTNIDGSEDTNEVTAGKLVKDLAAKVEAAGKDKSEIEAFTLKAAALKEWKEAAKKQGYSSKLIQLVEFMYQENFDSKKLQNNIDTESKAFSLIKFRESWKETLAGERREANKDRGALTFAEFKKELPQAYSQLITALEKATGLPEENFTLLGTRKVNEVIEEVLYKKEYLNTKHPPIAVGDVMVILPQKADKLNMYQLEPELAKELANVNSPLGHMVQLALAVSSFLLPTPLYLKTGTGIPSDLVEKYRKMIEANGGDVKSIFGKDGVPAFEEFARFIRTGEVGCGNNVISIPVNEVRLLLPGLNMLSKFVGSSGPSESCPTVSAGGNVGGGGAGGGA